MVENAGALPQAPLLIARDLTAPLAYAASQENDDWVVNFLRPGHDDTLDGLHMREPFQPGKIPVVLIHGLASDPLTWLQLENDLRAQPAIFNRYQFWYFRYDTGDPFLGSAAGCGESWRRSTKRTIRRDAIRTCRGWCLLGTAWADSWRSCK